ncbi:uncharacterized protein IL334_007450 [Kwoniella shivajii]|uniref:SGNH hydrolase-type esterase domain-containing protein n=1 Tax=Kwoniella shivajii TaxID=564305 RepID=A0ABZ1DCN4_9TREE|nr:hypothetical protein IL334_007450 [Kwoniella shivajii]
MSRRRVSPPEIMYPSRRVMRFCVLSFFIIAGVWVFTMRTDFGPLEDGIHLQKRQEAMDAEHPVDTFVKGFPQVRSWEETGTPVSEPEAAFLVEDGEITRKEPFDWPRVRKLFVFGDSFSTRDKDYRKDGVDGGHFQELLTCFSVFHDFHVLQYYNLAKVGATIHHSVLPPGLEEYGTYETQINDFEDLFTPLPGPWQVDWHSNDTLFIIFFGINDNRDDLHEGGTLDIPTTTKALVDSLMSQSRRLHSLGARNFLFMTLPPLHLSPKYKLPSQVGHDIHARVEQSIQCYNSYLRPAVKEFERELRDSNVMMFDLNQFWKLILDYPELFGITDISRFRITIDGRLPNFGRMGLAYHDNQHISWSSAELIARSVNGLLLRHSATIQSSNASQTEYTA